MFVCSECGGSQRMDGRCPADGTPLALIGDDILLGTTIGAYRVARLLGVGGMGRVYKGVQPQIGSRVAIKVLSRECSDRRDLVDRFFAEAKAVNLIRHESIVNVLDLATLPDGRPFIIMEYLDGAPLAAIIEQAQQRGMPLPLGGIARLAAEVLDALGAAHAKTIVHRDLKPDNIFVTPQGRPKVLDFGIAKLQPELGGSATHTGSLLGTPHYMSPEQAGGRGVDHRADIYAMGVILFECSTLQKPFIAASLFDLLRMHVEVPPPSPRALRRDMPPALESVIFTALAKQPDQRFASAQAMSMALQHATAQLAADQWAPILPGAARTPSGAGWAPTPPASWAGQVSPKQPTTSRSKKGMWFAIAIMLAVAGGIGAVVLATHGGEKQAAPVVAASPPAPTPVPTPEPEDKDDVVDVQKEVDTALKESGLPKSEQKKIKKQVHDALKVADTTGQQVGSALVQHAIPPPPSGSWVTNTRLDLPGFDPTHVDPQKLLPYALAHAKQLIPDAVLFRIDVDGVFPDGHADLTLAAHGSVDYRFISPSRAKRDPSLPIGAKQEMKCMFRVMIEQDGAIAMPINGWDCKEQLVGPPHCTFAAVWKKALAGNAPQNAIAELGYRSNDSRAVWYFNIKDSDVHFSEVYPDDCH